MKYRPTIVLACALLSLATAAQAQLRVLPGQQMRVLPDVNAQQADRIAALEGQIAALTDRLERAENSAREANFKAGAALSWIESNGASLPAHTHDYQRTTNVNHTCENANSGPDHVPCSQITGSSTSRTSPPQ